MTRNQAQPQQEAVPDGPAERGRYALNVHPDGGIVITRANGLCDTCLACGCGTPAEPLTIPAALAAMARAAAEGKMKLPSIGQLKQMAGNRGPRNGHR